MNLLHKHPATRRKGFSLVEVTVAMSIFSVIGYGLFAAVETSNGSQRAVSSAVAKNETMRSMKSIMADELKLAADDNITVVTLSDNNHQVTFMHPIQLAGSLGWGVFDPSLGPTEAEQNLPNWQVRYTVDSVVQSGNVNRRLVRQVLDDSGAIQNTDVLIEGLKGGGAIPPGFSVTRAGDMWEVQVTLIGTTNGGHGGGVSFHVKTRN